MLSTDDIVDLGAELQRAGFKVATHQYLAAHRVVTSLDGNSTDPTRALRLLSFLAPIFCTKSDEQERFGKIYLAWLARRRGIKPPEPEQKADNAGGADTWWKWFISRRKKLIACCICIIAVAIAWFGWHELKTREVTGSVMSDRKPLEGAQIQLGNNRALSGQEGRFQLLFRIKDLPASVTVEKEGHLSFSQPIGEDILESRKRFYTDRAGIATQVDVGNLDLPTVGVNVLAKTPPQQYELIVLKEDSPNGELRVESIARIDLHDVITIPSIGERILWMHVAMASVPLIIGGFWYVFRRRRRPTLQRMASITPPALRDVHVEGGTQSLFPSFPFRRLAQTMRSRRLIQSTELDSVRTIQATARQGGVFTPVYGSREEPGYVALIDRIGTVDHHARLALHLAADLMRSDVLLEPLEFDRDPTRLRRIEYGKRPLKPGDSTVVAAATIQTVTLEELQARYPTRRLLLFAEAASCFDPVTGSPQPWLDTLSAWDERFLITTEPINQWKRAEWVLEKRGFKVIPFGPVGFVLLSELLQRGTAVRSQLLPLSGSATPFYQRIPDQWLERNAPKPGVIGRLCSELEQNLGRPGFHWLCACAAYPEIHWGLTLRLGMAIVKSGEKLEIALPQLARLIWFREGFMPDWLRAALLQRMEPNEREHIRRELTSILSSVTREDEGSLVLRIATEEKKQGLFSWRRANKDAQALAREAPPSSPLRDYVFLMFMSGKSLDSLSPLAPNQLMRALFPDGHAWLGLRPWVIVSVMMLLSGALAVFNPIFIPLLGDPYAVRGVFTSQDGFLLVTEAGMGVKANLSAGKEKGSYDVKFDQEKSSHEDLYRAGLSYPISSLAWDELSKDIAVVTQKGKVLVAYTELKNRQFETVYTAKDGIVPSVALNPAKQLIAIADSQGAYLLFSEGKGQTVRLPVTQTNLVVFRPDGNFLATASSIQGTTLWDLQADQPRSVLSTSSPGIKTLAFNQDGTLIAEGGEDGTIHVWSVMSGQRIQTMKVGLMPIEDLTFSPASNQLAAIDSDGQIRLWDTSSFQLLHTIQSEAGHNGKLAFNIGDLDVTGRLQFLSVGDRSIAQVWQIPQRSTTTIARSVALLVGNNYHGQDYSLRGSIADARLLEPGFKRLGYQVVRREDVSREQLLDDLRALRRQLQPNDTLVLYLAGHGTEDKNAGFAFLGASGKTLDAARDGVRGAEIAEFFRSIPVKQALLVVDASYGRSLAKLPGPNENIGKNLRVRTILSSYTSDYPMDVSDGGPFAKSFASTLQELMQPTNGSSLTKEIAKRMALQRSPQTPTYEPFLAAGHTGGDFQFVVPKDVAQLGAKTNSVKEAGGHDAILEKSTSNPRDTALRSPGEQSSGSTFGSSSKRLPARGFAFYSSDKQRYFKLVNGDPFADPKNGDLVEAIGKVNVRKGYIQLKPEKGGWINQEAIGRIEPGDRLRILDIYRPVESFIWIEYELVERSSRNQDFRSDSPQTGSSQVAPQSLAPKNQSPTPAPGGNDINAAPQPRPLQDKQMDFGKQGQSIQQQQIEPEIVPPTEQKVPNTNKLPPSNPSNIRVF